MRRSSITHPSFHCQKGQHSGCQPAQQPPEHLLPLTSLPPVTIFHLCLLPPLGPLLLTFTPSHPDLQPQVLVMIAHCAEYRTYLWGLKLSTHRGKEILWSQGDLGIRPARPRDGMGNWAESGGFSRQGGQEEHRACTFHAGAHGKFTGSVFGYLKCVLCLLCLLHL